MPTLPFAASLIGKAIRDVDPGAERARRRVELRIIRRLEEVLAETRMQVLRRAKREGLTLLDNVVLLPHVGSATLETRTRMAAMAAQNLIAGLSGQTPPNVVNPEVFMTKTMRNGSSAANQGF